MVNGFIENHCENKCKVVYNINQNQKKEPGLEKPGFYRYPKSEN